MSLFGNLSKTINNNDSRLTCYVRYKYSYDLPNEKIDYHYSIFALNTSAENAGRPALEYKYKISISKYKQRDSVMTNSIVSNNNVPNINDPVCN